MRKLPAIIVIAIILLLIVGSVLAVPTNYYLSNGGNNGNIGTSKITAWQTIAKLNAMWTSIQPGDSILFERGGVFYGSLIVGKSGTSGNPIIIGCYGDVNNPKPIITGLTPLTSWSNAGGNTWNSIPAILPKSGLKMVLFNGIPQAKAQSPNGNTWYTYESHNGNTQITDNQLSGTPSLVGYEIHMKKEGYVDEIDKVTAHSGGTLTYTIVPGINPRDGTATAMQPKEDGFGWKKQGGATDLDLPGEWIYDSTAPKVVVYSTTMPTSGAWEVSTVDTLIDINTRNYITIQDIATKGAGFVGIFNHDGQNVTIKNCDVYAAGAKCIMLWNTPNTLIDNCTALWGLCGGIDVTGRGAANVTVRNCTVQNIYPYNGMGANNVGNGKGIYVSVSNTALIELNRVINIGYVGIEFAGNQITVQKNFGDTSNYNLDDGGFIYTYGGGTGNPIVNTNSRVVDHNIGLHSLGAPYGNVLFTHGEGLYCDGGARGISYTNNTTAYGAGSGWYLNDPKNVTVSGCTSYSNGNNLNNNGSGQGGQKHCPDSTYSFAMNNNIVWATNNRQKSFYYYNYGFNGTGTPIAANITAAMAAWGVIDGNYYNVASGDSAFVLWGENPCGGGGLPKSNKSFAQFQALQDAHSTAISVTGEHFYYNATMSDTTIYFTGRVMRDARGVNYNNFYVLHAFESAILYDVGSVTPPDPTPVGVPVYLPYKFIPN